MSFLLGRGFERIVLAGASMGSLSVGRFYSIRQHPNVVAIAHLMPTADCPDWFRRAAGDGPYEAAVAGARAAVAAGQGASALVDIDLRQPPPSANRRAFPVDPARRQLAFLVGSGCRQPQYRPYRATLMCPCCFCPAPMTATTTPRASPRCGRRQPGRPISVKSGIRVSITASPALKPGLPAILPPGSASRACSLNRRYGAVFQAAAEGRADALAYQRASAGRDVSGLIFIQPAKSVTASRLMSARL